MPTRVACSTWADDDHGSSSQEPDLVDVLPWGVKEQLTQEKTAIGFYLSGHLFDEVALEVRRFAKRQIDDLIDTREPQLLAGIVSDLRVINGQRGKLALFKLDDKSGVIEARADEALINAHRDLLKDDQLIIVMGKVQPDRFSGGMQLTVNQIWDLDQARCRFGKFLRVPVNGQAPDVALAVAGVPGAHRAGRAWRDRARTQCAADVDAPQCRRRRECRVAVVRRDAVLSHR